MLQHFSLVGATTFCELGSSMSCSRVLTSSYAVLLNAPVAVHGLSYFCLACCCSVLGVVYGGAQNEFRIRRDILLANLVVSFVGVLSVVYFVAAEVIIGSVCPLCTIIHFVVLFSFVVSLRQFQLHAPVGVMSFSSLTDIAANRVLFLALATVVVLLPVIIFSLPARHPRYASDDVAALAQCLTARELKMYGTNHCSHCISQKGLFGNSFGLISFVDCEKVLLLFALIEKSTDLFFFLILGCGFV